MKKSKRYSAIIVAALLATVPIFMGNKSNNVAPMQPTVVKAATETGKSINNPKKLTFQYPNEMEKKITWNKNLTLDPVIRFYSEAQWYAVDGEQLPLHIFSGLMYNVYNSKGKEIDIYGKYDNPHLKVGDRIVMRGELDGGRSSLLGGLEPNTWYQWTTDEEPSVLYTKTKIPKNVKKRYRIKKNNNGTYTITEKTDKYAGFISNANYDLAIYLPEVTLTVVSGRGNYFDKSKVKVTGRKLVGEKKVVKQTKSIKKRATTKTFTLKHNAYVYDKHGKKVNRSAVHKNSKIKAWNKGKIYTIKGKKFYRIGSNSYIKVSNVRK